MKSKLKTLYKSKFIKFVIIGILNTIIHLIIYNLLLIKLSVVVSHIIAFIVASIFSYFANVNYTYNQEASHQTFILSMLVFTIKLGLNAVLAKGFEYLFNQYDLIVLIRIIPILITMILLPLQFIMFNVIFKSSKKSDNNELQNKKD